MEGAKGLWDGLWNTGAGALGGAYNTVRHPVQTAKGVIHAGGEFVDSAKENYANFREAGYNPVTATLHTAATKTGDAIGLGQAYDAATAKGLTTRERVAQFTEGSIGVVTTAVVATKALTAAKAAQVSKAKGKPPKEVTVSRGRYPESAQHLEDAGAANKTLTVDRGGAQQRRREALGGQGSKAGLDRDEAPPAVFREGGSGASVRHIQPSDNRGSGASIGNQIRNVPDGGQVIITVDD